MIRQILVVLLFSLCLAFGELFAKHLAGPPSEFVDLPKPSYQAETQHSACFKVFLKPALNNELSQTLSLPVDSTNLFQFGFFSPYSSNLSLQLKDPHGAPLSLQGSSTFFPIGELHLPGTLYTFNNPLVGVYTLTVTCSSLSSKMRETLTHNNEADAYIIWWNDNPLSISTSLNTYSLTAGNQVGVVAYMFDSSLTGAKAIQETVKTARLNVVWPDGAINSMRMHDDGLHADSDANDGIYGGLITASEPGVYSFTATFEGRNDQNVEYVRSTTHLIPVVEHSILLTGTATGRLDSTGNRINIYLSAIAPSLHKYRVYAEVWGLDGEGNDIPIAWIGGMSFVKKFALDLELDLNWISMAEAQGPLTLRNVLVQDATTFIPIETAETISIKLGFELDLAMSNKTFIDKDGFISSEMREGKMPKFLASYSMKKNSAVPIALVHGYCAPHNSFQVFTNGSDWSVPRFYLDPNRNLPHDEFAVNISRWAANFGPFSYVGHSQGGAAGLHLKNFYFSGLDQVTGGRVLQSIGTPYRGSSGAGSAADLGKIFGATCGYNFDMTLDGAILWLLSITSHTRIQVHYYSTSYVKNQFLDNCNSITQFILKKPSDGVTEVEFAQLSGAQNEGNEERWCHVGGMKYPPQIQNSPRNVLMNALSARTPL